MQTLPPARPILDELDRRIIRRLRADPRVTNKALAEEVNVAEATIATRIKALENAHLMRVVARCDYRALGYSVFATADIDVMDRAVKDVAQDLAAIDEVVSVCTVLGSPSLFLSVMAVDLTALETLVLDRLSKVAGVREIRCAVITNMLKYESDVGTLGSKGSDHLVPGRHAAGRRDDESMHPPSCWFDSMDRQIIAVLRRDGRTSNREVARTLNVSEGMVRQRLKKMENARAMRLGVVEDVSIQELTASAYVFIRAVPAHIHSIASTLAQSPHCVFVGISIGGTFDIAAFVLSETKTSLADLIDNSIRMLPGVSRVRARELIDTTKHSYDVISIL